MQELRLRAAHTAWAGAQVTWLRDRLLMLGVEVALSALLDGTEADDAEHDDGADDDFGQAVPLLDELSALSDPCAGSARASDPVEDDTAAGASRDDTRDHLPAVVPTLDELTDLGDPCLRW